MRLGHDLINVIIRFASLLFQNRGDSEEKACGLAKLHFLNSFVEMREGPERERAGEQVFRSLIVMA